MNSICSYYRSEIGSASVLALKTNTKMLLTTQMCVGEEILNRQADHANSSA